MIKCEKCGGRLRRVHRTFFERFSYMAIYECRDCDREHFYPRRYTYHFGPYCRCPHCGAFRVTRLKAPDRIDPVYTGFLNYLERLVGGRLHHCRFCRVQFYDRRMLASEDKIPAQPPQQQEVASSRDPADSDA
jgi:DNA-directed RNA polymerase subunit RPC12/RpoP